MEQIKALNKSSKWVGSNAPRYTSYPTAPHFNSEINSEIYNKWLSNIKDNSNISLYIHIPFCKQLCWFCGCHTTISHYYAPISSYVELLLKEIELLSKKVNSKIIISHIHFGGGSPTILNHSDFQRIVDMVKSKFSISEKIGVSIEIDPRNIDDNKIALYKKNGVNRVSIGIQDFNFQTQMAVNRFQPLQIVESLFNQLRRNNINDINVDLIYGLPHQNKETIKQTINQTLKLKPNRIALFSYAHVPHMKKHQKLIDESKIVSNCERLEMFEIASDILQKKGYEAIGIDHFALKSDEMAIALNNKTLKRNFQGYTVDKANSLIGIGLSSIGKLEQGYIQNTTDIKNYEEALNNEELPIIKGIAISKEDKIRKEVIDNLMCFMEVDLKVIINKYQLSDNHFEKELNLIASSYKDIAQINNKDIKIISKHRMSTRAIGAIFDQYLQSDQKKYSKVV